MLITWKGADSITLGGVIEQPSQDEVKNTLSLWQADLDTAARYGGDLTRAALGAMNIRGDKRYILVDTKVHMLMPGQCPAIPGWHNDGSPREQLKGPVTTNTLTNGKYYSPLGEGPPDLEVQKIWDERGDVPRFHLLVTGDGCLTDFLGGDTKIFIPDGVESDLYKHISGALSRTPESLVRRWEVPTCTAAEWGWWHLHTAKLATKREWRFLIRVTESDYHAPQTDLSKIIRTQNTVYSPLTFGW